MLRSRAGAAVLVASVLLAPAACAATLAYVTQQGADSVAVVDVDAWRIVAQVKVGRKPAGVAVAPGAKRIFVSNPASATVSAITLSADGGARVVAEAPAGHGPLGIATDREGKLVFVADWYNDAVHVLDADTLDERRVLKVGRSPSGMAVSPDNKRLYLDLVGVDAGVDQNLIIGFGAFVFDGVGGVGFAGVVASGGEDGDFTSGGKAHDADFRRIDTPFVGTGADEADGALGVGVGMDLDLIRRTFFTSESVFKDEGGNANAVEPFGDVGALGVYGQEAMCTARRDDHCCAGSRALGEIDEKRWIVNAGDVRGVSGLAGGRMTSGLLARASEPGAPCGQRRTASP